MISVKLLQIMFGVIPHNLKKNDVSISNRFTEVHKHGTHTHTNTHTRTNTHTHIHTLTHTHSHTHTHDDSIRRYAMRCISPKYYSNETTLLSFHDHLANDIFHQQVSYQQLFDFIAVIDYTF